ncbi:MAG: hypothetical protein KAI18_00590 [Candidatus Aenigmarchaeota archaeon]|nr:hypothetical protein [Candidatus Aenigmarchaeota archaeon]
MMNKSADVSFKRSLHLSMLASFIVLVASLSSVSAVEFGEIQIDPNPAWIDPLTGDASVGLSVGCISDVAVNVSAAVNESFETNQITMILSEENNGSYVYVGSFIVEDFGNHTLDIICVADNETIETSSSFFAKRQDMDIVSISETEVYGGNYSILKTRLAINNESIVSGADFVIRLSDTNSVWNIDVSKASLDEDVHVLEWDIPNLEAGAYTLEVFAQYDNHSVSVSLGEQFAVRPLVDIDILEPLTDRVYSFSETEQLEIVVRANVNPFLVDKLYQSQFYAKLDGKKLQVENFTYDSNTKTYHFVVDVYRVDSDDYEYKMSVYIRPDGFSEQKSDAHIDIQFMVPFELDMKNAKDKPVVDAKIVLIKMSGGATYDECITDSYGVCSTLLYPGTYDMTIDIDEVSVNVNGVELPGESNIGSVENIISYDNPGNIKIDGFKEIQMIFAVEFLLPFEHASVSLYNIRLDINNSVLRCDGWDLKLRTCSGGWVDISSMSEHYSNKIVFSTDAFSAFAVGTRDALSIEMDELKERVYIGENVILSGIAYGADGAAVNGATITYGYGGNSGTIITDVDGIFTVDVKAPMVAGDFKATVEAIKEPYVSAQSMFSFETYKSEAFEIVLEKDLLVLEPGMHSSFSAMLKNTGQATIEDIKVTIEGINPAWIDISPVSIGVLGVGKYIDVQFNVSIPEYTSDCDTCLNHYLLSLSAESGKGIYANKDIELDVDTADIDIAEAEKIDSTASSFDTFSFSAGMSSISNTVTGFVLGGQGNGLFLLMFIFVSIFLFNKRFMGTPHVAIAPQYLDHLRTEVLRSQAVSSLDLKKNKKSSGVKVNKQKDKIKKKSGPKRQEMNKKSDLKDILSNPFE